MIERSSTYSPFPLILLFIEFDYNDLDFSSAEEEETGLFSDWFYAVLMRVCGYSIFQCACHLFNIVPFSSRIKWLTRQKKKIYRERLRKGKSDYIFMFSLDPKDSMASTGFSFILDSPSQFCFGCFQALLDNLSSDEFCEDEDARSRKKKSKKGNIEG